MAVEFPALAATLLVQVFVLSFCHNQQEHQFYWSRSSSELSPYSMRTSHIGPVPHINEIMTEWATWGFWGRCSRSCGGGVRSRTRTCIAKYPRVMPGSGIRTSHDHCTGDTVQYEVCGTDPCPAGQVSGVFFRAAQCRHHNNKRVLGRVINSWVPYTQGGINPCSLVCEGEGEGIVYTFGKVTDGTYCKTEERRQGLCVNGRCLRLSCDGRLGGNAFEDMCRVCDGKNETCTRHSGVFHSERPSSDQPYPGSGISPKMVKKIKRYGYYEVTKIPSGSTNVKVTDNSSNFLALKSGDKYLLNGDWLIDWPGEIDAAGASFSYSRKEDQSESLASLGPTNSDLALMVLLREENPGIYYEYWTRNSKLKDHLKPNSRPQNYKSSNTSLFEIPKDTLVSKATLVTSAKAKAFLPLPKTRLSSASKFTAATTKSKLKPAVLNGFSLNKTFLTKPPSSPGRLAPKSLVGGGRGGKGPKESEGEEDGGAKREKGAFNRHETSKPIPKTKKNDPKFGGGDSFNLKKSASFKLPSWNPNSVYETPFPPRRKTEKEKNYSLKALGKDYASKKSYYEKKKKKKKKKKRKRKKKKRPSHCKPCLVKVKAKKSFCTSDFVSRVQILSEEVVGQYSRLETLVLQSYKNTVPLLHKEFLWQDVCSCRRLKPGRSYIVMGVTKRSRGNEVKLVLRREAFVKRFSHKIVARIMKIRQNEMRFCRSWRKGFNLVRGYSYEAFLKRYLKRNRKVTKKNRRHGRQ